MRLSQATVKFLGKLSARMSSFRASVFVSEGCIYGRIPPWGLAVTVIDYKASPEWGTYPERGFLSVLQGCNTDVELIIQADRTEIASKGTTFKVPSCWDKPDDAPIGFEGWDRSYKVEDPETLITALREGLATCGKDEVKRLDVVHLDNGEVVATDGHRATIRYCGVDGQAAIPRAVADVWLKMLMSFSKSHGGWWFQTSNDGLNPRAALVFRHFGQEVRVSCYQAPTHEGFMTAAGIRKTMSKLSNKESEAAAEYDPRALRDFCKLFDTLALYSNGTIVGWVEREGNWNNGNDGLVPRGEKPLGLVTADLLAGMLPKVSNKGYAPPVSLRFTEPFEGETAKSSDGRYKVILVGDGVLMSRVAALPELPVDAYETAPAAVKAA